MILQEWFRDIPPTLARFCPTDPSLIVYSGYSINKEMLIYSLEQKLVQYMNPFDYN